jgi:hypothetical protein
MAVPTRTELGASTLARMWYLDVDSAGSSAAPVWLAVLGMTEFKPALEPTLQDDSDYDGGGFMSSTKTAEKWSVESKIARKTTEDDGTAYDPGQEFLRSKAFGKMGPANRVHIRYYEMTEDGPRSEAYEGWAAVTWSPDGGKMDDLNLVSLTLTGQGRLSAVTHPDTGVSLPVVTLVDPDDGVAAGGALVEISGANFAGATAVKFATTSAASFDVVSGGTIEVIAPAHAAGQVDVTVVTPAGTSATSAATKFTYA